MPSFRGISWICPLKAALAHLPRLAELGVTILYLCPVSVSDDHPDRNFWSPRQIKSGMDNPRNPYRIKDYYNIDPDGSLGAPIRAGDEYTTGWSSITAVDLDG